MLINIKDFAYRNLLIFSHRKIKYRIWLSQLQTKKEFRIYHMKNIYPLCRSNDLVIQRLSNEVLIYDLKENKAFCLNETAALVWEECNGKKNIEEISQSVSEKLNLSPNPELVWLGLDQLKKKKLLINSAEITENYNGVSRREAIRKVGLSSLVALPLVISVTTPSSIQAASCAPVGVSVGVASDCSTLNDSCCSMNSVAFAGAGGGQFACACVNACIANGQAVGIAADCSTLSAQCCSMNAVAFAGAGGGQFACACQPV